MFSPPATLPVRSSPPRWIQVAAVIEPNALPSAWTTPLRPSPSSYRQPRSRSTAEGDGPAAAPLSLAKKPPPAGGAAGAPDDQFRLTRAVPPTAPALVSATFGGPLGRITLPAPERAGRAPAG